MILGEFDPKKETAFLLGRFQPPHEGHLALVVECLKRHSQVCIGVREPVGDDKNPFTFEQIEKFWVSRLNGAEIADRVCIVRLPNIAGVFYGRDVGYKIERIDLDSTLQAVSATDARARMFSTGLRGKPTQKMIVRGTPGVI